MGLPQGSAIPLQHIWETELKNIYSHMNLYMDVYISIIPNCPNVGTAQMSIN